MKHDNCPVCGYAEMPYPPKPYKICPCCGTEFGVDDYYHTREELRRVWINAGFPWFSDIRRPPKNWSPVVQLINAGYGVELFQPTGAATKSEQAEVRLGTKMLWNPVELNTLTIQLGTGV